MHALHTELLCMLETLQIIRNMKTPVMLLHVASSVCVSVCPVYVLTFESLDLETYFWYTQVHFRIFRSSLYVKVIGSRSRSQKQKMIYKRN